MNLENEIGVKVFTDFTHLRFVRELEWMYPHMPSKRALAGCEILAYAHGVSGPATRVFYIVADPDDGIELTPSEDIQGGIPVLTRTVAARTPAMPYTYVAEEVAAKERKRRAPHVAYWSKAHNNPGGKKPEQPKPKRSWWSRILEFFGRK